MTVYSLSFALQFITMYCLPGGNDIFAFTNPFPMFIIMLVGSLYATSLACVIASFCRPRAITAFLIVVFALMLGGILCFSFLGNTLLYDPSIMPTGFLRFLVRWLFPFAPILQSVNFQLSGNAPEIYLNSTSLDYKLIPNKNSVTVKQFFSIKDAACKFESCEFT